MQPVFLLHNDGQPWVIGWHLAELQCHHETFARESMRHQCHHYTAIIDQWANEGKSKFSRGECVQNGAMHLARPSSTHYSCWWLW